MLTACLKFVAEVVGVAVITAVGFLCSIGKKICTSLFVSTQTPQRTEIGSRYANNNQFRNRKVQLPPLFDSFSKVMQIVYPLSKYYPSADIENAKKYNFSDASLSCISANLRTYISNGHVLNANNITEVLTSILEIEDLETTKDFNEISQKRCRINVLNSKQYYVNFTQLPNDVSPADEITLDPVRELEYDYSNFREQKSYFAVVDRVKNNTIYFNHEKKILDINTLYDIVVRRSRLMLRYQYKALSMLNSSAIQYLFPQFRNSKFIPSKLTLELFNPSVKHNPEQLQAVCNIANGPNPFAPYVIFGPPGTGKTSTIVEAVLQLWKRRPDTRILITAGSNGACDEVASRLCRYLANTKLANRNILRLYSKSNEKRIGSLDKLLLQCSNLYGQHIYPEIEVVRKYRIIVCTLPTVGKLVTADIGNTFFTHIFIDECASSTVPESLVGWMGTSSEKTRLIVLGDHKQLGPILQSKRAAELGLGISLIEILMRLKCYAVDMNGDYDHSIQTRLIRNYRSHPKIVGLYNAMYYNNELRAMAKEEDTDWGLQFHLLPNKNQPILFHSVYGRTVKNQESFSLYNDKEITTVMMYVKVLLKSGIKGLKIEQTDIGIISPYKCQFNRIQDELKRCNWQQIEVGAVETFQGKEKSIIIVSTVRSFSRTLGFLENPRRLNVILSRPKVLLIIVGNPITLKKNKDFRYIIDYCIRNNCMVDKFREYDDQNEEVHSPQNSSKQNVPNYKVMPQLKLVTQQQSVTAVTGKVSPNSLSNGTQREDENCSILESYKQEDKEGETIEANHLQLKQKVIHSARSTLTSISLLSNSFGGQNIRLFLVFTFLSMTPCLFFIPNSFAMHTIKLIVSFVFLIAISCLLFLEVIQ